MQKTNKTKINVSWEEIEPLVGGKYKPFFEQINPELYELVLDENNEQTVKESILKSLKSDYPNNATEEIITAIYNLMKKVAESIENKE